MPYISADYSLQYSIGMLLGVAAALSRLTVLEFAMLPSANPSGTAPRKIGVVGVVVREAKLLVIQRSATVRAPLKYCFPGGAMEHGESEAETLVRELREELGVLATPRQRLHASLTPWNVDLRWWQAEIDAAAEFQLNALEVAAMHWCSVPEILALPNLLESNRIFLSAWHEAKFEIEGLTRPTVH